MRTHRTDLANSAYCSAMPMQARRSRERIAALAQSESRLLVGVFMPSLSANAYAIARNTQGMKPQMPQSSARQRIAAHGDATCARQRVA